MRYKKGRWMRYKKGVVDVVQKRDGGSGGKKGRGWCKNTAPLTIKN
jgi:hypothetical protein